VRASTWSHPVTWERVTFGHNLCFKCSNDQCEIILDIYVPRDFQWYKERHNPLSFDPWNYSLKFRESTGTPSPKVGVALGVWGFIPSHFLTLPGVCDVTPGLPFGPHFCNPFALVASPKLRLQQPLTNKDISIALNKMSLMSMYVSNFQKMIVISFNPIKCVEINKNIFTLYFI